MGGYRIIPKTHKAKAPADCGANEWVATIGATRFHRILAPSDSLFIDFIWHLLRTMESHCVSGGRSQKDGFYAWNFNPAVASLSSRQFDNLQKVICGYSPTVGLQLPKLGMRVRIPLAAPTGMMSSPWLSCFGANLTPIRRSLNPLPGVLSEISGSGRTKSGVAFPSRFFRFSRAVDGSSFG